MKLHGHHCQISVHREGKHMWLAVGDYLGKEIRVQAESEGTAGYLIHPSSRALSLASFQARARNCARVIGPF